MLGPMLGALYLLQLNNGSQLCSASCARTPSSLESATYPVALISHRESTATMPVVPTTIVKQRYNNSIDSINSTCCTSSSMILDHNSIKNSINSSRSEVRGLRYERKLPCAGKVARVRTRCFFLSFLHSRWIFGLLRCHLVLVTYFTSTTVQSVAQL